MDGQGQTRGEQRRQIEVLTAQIERLRVVAEAANRASIQIDTKIRSLEPRVNTMQEAAVALSTLVNLTGAIQRELVGGSTSWRRAMLTYYQQIVAFDRVTSLLIHVPYRELRCA